MQNRKCLALLFSLIFWKDEAFLRFNEPNKLDLTVKLRMIKLTLSSLPILLPQIIFYLFVFYKVLERGFIWLFFGLFEPRFFQSNLISSKFSDFRDIISRFFVLFLASLFFDFWSIIFELRKKGDRVSIWPLYASAAFLTK